MNTFQSEALINIIYKMHTLSQCIVLSVLLLLLTCQPPDYALITTPASYFIQDITNYVFTISITGDGVTTATVLPGSTLIINFPAEYTSSSNQSYVCSIIPVMLWPMAASPLTCSMNYNIMTVQGVFPNVLNIAEDSNYVLKLVINSIKNPSYAQTTSKFSGQVLSGGSQVFTFEPTNSAGLAILSGSLAVSLSVSPTTADSISTLTVACQPTHSIPLGGVLRFTVEFYWSTSVFRNRGTISQTPICVGLNNTLSNLYCTYTFSSTTFTVTVLNIFSAASNTSFSFTLFPFSNPPSGQPIGSMTFQTFSSSSGSLIDSSTNNQITGITPTAIQNPKLSLSSYALGTTVQAVFSVLITNGIAMSDVLYISTPSEINVANVQQVSMAGTTTTFISILSSSLFSFTKVALGSSFAIDITAQSITLPNYAAAITAPFQIYVLRNSFLVCSVSASFNVSLDPGVITATLAGSNLQAGVVADYSFFLSFQHSLQPTSRLSFYFNPQYFSIGSGISCISSGSSNCTVLQTSNNTIVVQSLTLSATSTLNIVVSGILNPSAIGNFTAVMITSYFLSNGTFYIQDVNQNSAYFSLTSRPLALSNVNVSASSYQVYALADYTFQLKNNNHIAANSYIWIVFPSDISFSAISCNQVCISGTLNGSQGVQFQQMGPLSASTLFTLVVNHVINPISTKPTSSFGIYIYNSQNQLLEYLTNGPSFAATIPSVLSISVISSSVRNSEVGWFNITLSPNYAIVQAVAVVLVVPSGLTCPTCPSQSINSSYNQLIYYNQIMNSSFQLNLPNFTNYFSYQPITLQAAVMSNNLFYNYANGSLSRANQQPSAPVFLYSFTKYELSTITDLLVTNLTSGTLTSNVFSVVVTFGADFTLASANCTSNGYSCAISNNQVTFVVTNPGSLPMLTIRNIISPSLSPSTSISLSTYSSLGHLIDQNSIMVWTIACQLPCRTCQPLNTSACLSCYSNLSLVTNEIYYFGGNHSCVSDCGLLYYKNTSTNACEACSALCGNCYNYSFCTSCPANQYLLLSNSTCYSLCPRGYFAQATQCIACTAGLTCYACSDELTCSSCMGKFYYQLQCLPNCPIGITTPNTTLWICQACPVNCSYCVLSNSSVVCTSCSSGLLDSGRCVNWCQSSGTVANGLICSACDSNCLTCQGNPAFCLTCNTSSSQRYFLANRCFVNCPNTYYNDNNSNFCLGCNRPCEICTNFSQTSCISCVSGYSLYNFICQSNCPSRFYSNFSQCVSCVTPCLTCSAEAVCFSCQSNYSLVSSNNSCLTDCPYGYISINQTCVQCSGNCLTCVTLNFCLTCPNTAYLLNGSCFYPCPAGYYANAIGQSCSSCPYSCAVCFNLSFCTRCITGYEVQSNYSCLSLCPSNQVPISGLCQNCTSNCSSCQTSIYNCTACASGYLYVQALFSCLSSCPPAYYYYPLNASCLNSCPAAFYPVTDNLTLVVTCTGCSQYCASCLSGLSCSSCAAGAYIYLSLCYSPCPSLAPYAFGGGCQTCNVVDCFACSGLVCASCVSGKLLIGSSLCLSGCSSSQVYNSISRTCDTIGNSSSAGAMTASSSNLMLNFIPMPFLIVYSIAVIIVVLLSCNKKVVAVSTLFALVGPFLTLACLILIIVSYSVGSATGSLPSAGIYMVIGGWLIMLFTNAITVYLRWKVTRCERSWALGLAAVHFSFMALMTANIGGYNSYFVDQHRPFWRTYKLISKNSTLANTILFIGGVMLVFGVADRASYVFYAGIQLILLAVLTAILTWAWLLVPLEEPTAQIVSEQSSENVGSQNMEGMSEKTERFTPDPPEQSSQQTEKKLRKSEIKSEGDSGSQTDEAVGRARSNYEFNRFVGVVQVNREEIAQALQRGLFRKDKEAVLKQIAEMEELSRIESAAKLNNYVQTRKEEERNIFQDDGERTEQEEVEDRQAQVVFKEQEQKEVSSKKSSEFATFNQVIFSKEQDFQHNIIFEEDEENVTFYEDEDEDGRSVSPNVFDRKENSMLGITPRETAKIRVESRQSPQYPDTTAPIQANKMNETVKVTVLDVEDNQSELSQIQVFADTGRSRIKPMLSKHMKKSIEPQDIIHADFEQIVTVSDGGSLQFFQDDQQRNESHRKIRETKPSEVIQDLDQALPPPSDIFRQASLFYQPKVQKNQPPKQKQLPVRGRRRK